MGKQLLIYERATPINPSDHRDISVRMVGDFSFAKEVNSTPLMSVEFDLASAEYAIVFARGGDGGGIMPAALLGIRANENLYMDESGAWNAKYIPAFVRRYPFVFASSDAATFTLCLDESFPGVNRRGLGERLFDAEGQRTQYLQNVLNFLQSYQLQFDATRAFVQRLTDLDLLESMQAQFTLRTGQAITLGGFMAISRARLRALPGEALEKLAASGDLDHIYAHLHSQRNFQPTAERILRVIEPTASPVPAEIDAAA